MSKAVYGCSADVAVKIDDCLNKVYLVILSIKL